MNITSYGTPEMDSHILKWFSKFLNSRLNYRYQFLQVLVCGDLRGNMVLFPLAKRLVLDMSVTQEVKISPVNYFKGVHGISSVSSVSVTVLSSNQIEICSVS